MPNGSKQELSFKATISKLFPVTRKRSQYSYSKKNEIINQKPLQFTIRENEITHLTGMEQLIYRLNAGVE